MKTSEYYDNAFYQMQKEKSYSSASIIVPILNELISPDSVIDVGCGMGTWLRAFEEEGVEDVIGVDGSYVNRSDLYLRPEKYLASDLSMPLKVDRRFDLAISLEVGEHICEQDRKTFFNNIIALSDAVFFSAAIPYQGGSNHVNERWQADWAELFYSEDYVALDTIRRKMWNSDEVELHYIQNSMIYVKRSCLEKNPALYSEYERSKGCPISLVHPKVYEEKCDYRRQTVRTQFFFFLKVLRHRLKKRFIK
jgi:cyclopropane fatty-acyl-phospholipid synthase-like methyltransferase